jgi:diacylglycerol kinase (ATP)
VRTLAIVNPSAGGGRCRTRYPAAVARLREAGVEVDVALTERAGHATALARRAFADGVRRFIACGGDGTTHEVVNGVLPEAKPGEVTLGFLPLGTGNSFLRDFSDRPEQHAFEALAAARARACDVLRVEHADGVLYSLNLLSVGFVADVNATTHRRFKRMGEAGYSAGVVWELAGLRARPFPMQLDDGDWDATPLTFASFNNSRFTGGKMMMAPHADPSDGCLDVIRASGMSRLRLLATFPRIFGGSHVEQAGIRSEQAREVRFAGDTPVDVMVDGEVARIQLQRIVVEPAALEVLA